MGGVVVLPELEPDEELLEPDEELLDPDEELLELLELLDPPPLIAELSLNTERRHSPSPNMPGPRATAIVSARTWRPASVG